MKLFHSPTSPYVRKVVVTAIECGLDARIERVPGNYRDPTSPLHAQNPLGKVPALIRDDGKALIDSPVICEYLDSLHHGPKLIPASGDARWAALHLQALADGILDAAILYQNERTRPDGERSPAQVERQRQKALTGFDAIERAIAILGGSLDIGQIALAAAIGWIDFRIGRDFWAEGRPKLAAWFAEFSKRPSMVATAPKDPA
jgi:glutathione S-transferase